ncbi:MAG TPA: tetratricopeptide repeat protein [Gemmatimonadales bacterium]|nr:tetratricopeptide repeat protein [Gemmatimonadales bacterium]
MLGTTTAILLSGVGRVSGQVQKQASQALGTVNFPVSCSEQAQIQFNHAVALLHHMTYPGAREAFQQVAKTDSRCAMAHWGIAMTLFQPLWPTRPTSDELRRGWEAAQNARALDPPTRRERLLVDAAAAFFGEPESPDYWQRIRRWEKAMESAYTAFPGDTEVAVFYALAHLSAAPPDSTSQANSERAAGLLLAVYQRNPDHPGAMHYLVHANDAPARERKSLEITRKYETLAPRNPHALHMPTHIYTRLGEWKAVISGNMRAAAAALEQPAGDRSQFVWDEFPHAIEYLVYAHLQMGSDEQAAAQLKRLHGTARLQPTFKTAYHLASTRARYALERHAWREAMSLVPREPASLNWNRFTWPEAVTWFARGLGAAHQRNVERVRLAAAHLDSLETAAGTAGEALFARNIQILRLGVRAWLAHAQQDTVTSVALMRKAAELEAATPKHAVTPAPTMPAYELLGDLLLEQGNAAEALAAYRRSLDLYPRRFNSLLGAARAARRSGDFTRARTLYQELLALAAGATKRSGVKEARMFVSIRH